MRGIELRPDNEPHTLESLYRRLLDVFFGVIWYQPDEAVLRLEVARFELRALIIIDCDITAHDLGRLLGTFAGCTFLLTSHRRTLAYDAGTALEVDRSGLQRFARVYHAARQCPQLEPVRLFHQQHTIALDEEGERGKMGRPRWCPDCHPPGLPRAALVQEVLG
jgi:hypothetical protein